MSEQAPFKFQVSLSVLEHLGRNLYRSVSTVLGEAISNSWDADATKVQVSIDRDRNELVIADNGIGMTAPQFQNQFLKIGYSKRREGKLISDKGRPYIGRKGIGKLALLSCSEQITVITRKEQGSWTGGTIDNKGLDSAIQNDLTPDEYPLVPLSQESIQTYTEDIESGTIVVLHGFRGGVRNNVEYFRKVIALYFRFSLLDDTFKIVVNGEEVTLADLQGLAERTEFLWQVNDFRDPYCEHILKRLKESRDMTCEVKARGFVASVEKPRDLAILETDERVGVDLFVNGRMRERDILKHIPTARVAESYFYGQLHFDMLDDELDRFTSSREGIVADDPLYQDFLGQFRKCVLRMIEDWDTWRRKHRKDGDPESKRVPRKKRKSEELLNAVAEEDYSFEDAGAQKRVSEWISELREDAAFNIESYAECFVSENLVRKYIEEEEVEIIDSKKEEADRWRTRETENKGKGNVSIDIREDGGDISYLSMDDLAYLVDRKCDKNKDSALTRDATEYKPMRDAVAHTSRLTGPAKRLLTAVYENVKARIRYLLQHGKMET